MAESEISIINHLLEVEQNAYLQVKTAQEESNKLLSQARAQADSEYKAQFEKLSSEMEENYKNKIAEVSAQYKKQVEDYKASVENTQQDKASFNDFLKKVVNE